MKKVLIAVILAAFLSGCQTMEIREDVPHEKPPLNIGYPPELSLKPVHATVVLDSDPPMVQMPLTSYKSIIQNNSEIRAWVDDVRKRIDSCEEYYTTPTEVPKPEESSRSGWFFGLF